MFGQCDGDQKILNLCRAAAARSSTLVAASDLLMPWSVWLYKEVTRKKPVLHSGQRAWLAWVNTF